MTKQDTQKRINLTKRVIYKKSAPVSPPPHCKDISFKVGW